MKSQQNLVKHQDFAKNWEGYTTIFDTSIMMDNNADINEGKAPSVISVSKKGENTIFNREAYERARNKIYINSEAKTKEEVFKDETSSRSSDKNGPEELERSIVGDTTAGVIANRVLNIFGSETNQSRT
jgi:rRNA maturation endonuclease Nob1